LVKKKEKPRPLTKDEAENRHGNLPTRAATKKIAHGMELMEEIFMNSFPREFYFREPDFPGLRHRAARRVVCDKDFTCNRLRQIFRQAENWSPAGSIKPLKKFCNG
jgi:hypothetical protein